MTPLARYWQDTRYTYFSTPFNAQYVDDLKDAVPARHRMWDKVNRVWRIESPYEFDVFDLCKIYHGGAREVDSTEGFSNDNPIFHNNTFRTTAANDPPVEAAAAAQYEARIRSLEIQLQTAHDRAEIAESRTRQAEATRGTIRMEERRNARQRFQFEITALQNRITNLTQENFRLGMEARRTTETAPSTLTAALLSVIDLSPLEVRAVAYSALAKVFHPDVTKIKNKSLANSAMQTLNQAKDRYDL